MWDQWDIGVRGLAVLGAYSVGFGVVAQILMWRSTTHWLWLIAAGTFFVTGLLISEWWFGSATGRTLQPNIDGLSRDEALLALVPATAVVCAAWFFGRGRIHRLSNGR